MQATSTHAHIGQSTLPNSLTSIVADALRGAALAPTVGEALDVAGAALCSIASLARIDPPAQQTLAVDAWATDSLCVARNTANDTLLVLDRLASLFASIARLARDTDDAIEELACIGAEIVEAETDRVDTALALLTRQAHPEVQHA